MGGFWWVDFEKFGAKYGRKWNFQTPISPPNGNQFPPFKNHFYQGLQGYNDHESDRGSGPPKWSNSKSGRRPKNFKPQFLKNVSSEFSKNFRVERAYEYLPLCKFWGNSDEGKNITSKFSKKFFRGPDPQTVQKIPSWLGGVCRGHWPLSKGTWNCDMGQANSEKFGVEWKPLAPPSVETGSSYVTWLDRSTGVDGVYVVSKFEDIRSTRFGVMGVQSFADFPHSVKNTQYGLVIYTLY